MPHRSLPLFAFRGSRVLLFGCGEVTSVGDQARRFGRRALIVTGRSSARGSGALSKVVESLRAADLEMGVYDGVQPEPTLEDVERGREEASRRGAELVVAIGGGSAIDVGKAIAALGRSDEPVRSFHGSGALEEPGLPCIALPTTSGTGAEVTPNSVLTDAARNVKTSIRGDALIPEVAIVDPELTLSLPPAATAHSGLDALCQAMEAYVSTIANPISDAMALAGCERLARSLERAVADGADLAARTDMALGSLLAGYALASARLGLVHGLAHPVGTLTHQPHGLICGLLLAPVVRANAPAAAERYARLAEAAGLPPTGDAEARALALADWVEALCTRVGTPTRLGALGVGEEHVAELARAGASAGSTRFNPFAVTAEDLEGLLRSWL